MADAPWADDLLELAGLMTHFATADELGDDHFPRQLERFTAFARAAREPTPTRSSTPPTAPPRCASPASHFDMVRCGIAVYGLDPFNRTRPRTAWSRR